MLIGRALKYKAHLLGLHPLLLWKVFVKDTGLRGDTEAVDAIIRFAFGETTESLTEKNVRVPQRGTQSRRNRLFARLHAPQAL